MSTINSTPKEQFASAVSDQSLQGLYDMVVASIRGANINKWDGDTNYSPLKRAIGMNRPDIVEAMLKLGADPNLPAELPSLHYAVKSGDLASTRLLVEAGAHLDMQIAGDRGTPLHCAVEEGSVEIMKYLLGAGASPGIFDRDGRKPLDWARELGCKSAIVLLSRHEQSKSIATKRIPTPGT